MIFNKTLKTVCLLIGGATVTFGALLAFLPEFVLEALGTYMMFWFALAYGLAGFVGVSLCVIAERFITRAVIAILTVVILALGAAFKFAPIFVTRWSSEFAPHSIYVLAGILIVGAVMEFAFARQIKGQPKAA